MHPTQEKIITIDTDGTITAIYDDRLKGLANHGTAETKRASHVEPGDPAKGQENSKWYADMAPSNGPVLGPFDSREEALGEEVVWLNTHVLESSKT